MCEIFLLLSSLQFCHASANIALFIQMICHAGNDCGIFIPDFHHFKLLHVDIGRNTESSFFSNGDNWFLIHHFLRHCKPDGSPFSRFTFYRNCTVHFVNQRICNCQSKTDSALLPLSAAVYLIKPGKNILQTFFCHTNSGILDSYHQIDSIAFPSKLYTNKYTADIGKLDGIIQQIHNDSA